MLMIATIAPEITLDWNQKSITSKELQTNPTAMTMVIQFTCGSLFKANVEDVLTKIRKEYTYQQYSLFVELFEEIIKDNYTRMDSADVDTFKVLQGQNHKFKSLIKSLSTARELKYKDYV